MPRFGKDKSTRNEELDRQAAEEVERLTRRGGQPAMGGMPGMSGPPRMGPPSPLEMMAAEVADAPPPSKRRAQTARRPGARPQQAFTPMPSGEVGSSFGPGGLNPGPAGGFSPPPPPAFGGGAQEDFGGPVTGPPVFQAEPDEDEEMSITEMALMDHAARTGHDPEDLVMMYDASSAEEMRDQAMRRFYERQQSRQAGPTRNDPFAPAGMRRGPAPAGPARRPEDPKTAGGALAQRLADRRRREEEAARRAAPPPAPKPAPAPAAAAAAPAPAAAPERKVAVDEGRLAQVLAKRRAALGLDSPSAPEPAPAEEPAPGRRHTAARAQSAPPLRAVPTTPDDDDEQEAPAPTPARATRKAAAKTAKAPAAKKATAAKKAPAAKAATAAPAAKPRAKKKAGATLATPPPAAKKKAAAKATGKAKTVFCIECGEKNPAIAKFCFNCGTRLAVPEG